MDKKLKCAKGVERKGEKTMITQTVNFNERPFGTTRTSVVTNYGLSTDTKPTTAKNGDVFFEMDTSKAYMYNEASTTWTEL